jgi:DNA-directed RNA polymerase specialized sigma24 family protein
MMDFHSLYQSYAPQVHRFVLFLCGDASLADDITSETFVRAWTSRGKIREATVKAYCLPSRATCTATICAATTG